MKNSGVVKFYVAAAILGLSILLASCSGSDKQEPKTDVDIEQEMEQEGTEVVSKCGAGKNTNNPVNITTSHGANVRVCDPDSPLDGSMATITDQAFSDFSLEIKLADSDIQKDGWKAIGPPVLFEASDDAELSDDAPFTIPIDKSKLTDDIRNYTINVLLAPADGSAVRFVPKSAALIKINREVGTVSFESDKFGVYQVVVPSEVHDTKMVHYTFRAIAGVSMGGGGAAYIGLKHPEDFDIIGMLGGPFDLTYLMHMLGKQLMGGFCTPDEFIDSEGNVDEAELTNPMHECGVCMNQPSPLEPEEEFYKCYLSPPEDPENMEHPNGFNHWYYDDNGGSFDREEYVKLFRDLSLAFGNPISYHPDTPYLPAGLPTEVVELARTNPQTFCDPEAFQEWMNQHGYQDKYPLQNFYDDEFNPDGSLPVIMFCDSKTESHKTYSGDFDPTKYDMPMEVALAVDINGNGKRDWGEPVIRNQWEPYEDCGLDRLCDPDEPGYDPVNNPDPNGDDYNPFTNPTGTEDNWLCDNCDKQECTAGANDSLKGVCEKWEDFGIDGVEGTPQLADGGYDYGEGNGKFDLNPNVAAYYSEDPHHHILNMEPDKLWSLHIWMDGGVRDIFNFAVHGNQIYGLINSKMGEDFMKMYNGIESLLDPPGKDLRGFNFMKVDYGKLGHDVFLRYGHMDATPKQIQDGDGRHVGTPQEIIYRVLTFLAYAAYHFPHGDITPVENYSLDDTLIAAYFYSEHMQRERRFSIMLPPGYNDPEFENTTYPVIYFMHGYGQEPKDLALGFAMIMPLMAEGKIPKFIAVFPDGKCESPEACEKTCKAVKCASMSSDEQQQCYDQCRTECSDVHRECVQGSFYVNHRATYDHITRWQDGERRYGQIEDYFYDLVDYIESTYRTTPPADVEVDAVTGDWVY